MDSELTRFTDNRMEMPFGLQGGRQEPGDLSRDEQLALGPEAGSSNPWRAGQARGKEALPGPPVFYGLGSLETKCWLDG